MIADILSRMELFRVVFGDGVTRPNYQAVEIGFKRNFGTWVTYFLCAVTHAGDNDDAFM